MSDLPRYLRELDEALLDLPDAAEAMLLSEVDGYACGLALLPDDIPESEWLPAIWRPDPATPDYLYHDQALLDDIARLATQHVRMVARDLHRGEFEPIYDVDPSNEDLVWEGWISGFDRAMALRSEAFNGIDTASEAVQDAFSAMLTLAMLAEGEGETENPDAAPDLTSAERDQIGAAAPDLIPQSVDTLYMWSRSGRPLPDFAVPVRKAQIGRNDPCPCGSGRKYKKCCGASA